MKMADITFFIFFFFFDKSEILFIGGFVMQNSIILHLVICFCLSFTKFIQNLITYLFSNYEAKFNYQFCDKFA
jgi:hypothetical protein